MKGKSIISLSIHNPIVNNGLMAANCHSHKNKINMAIGRQANYLFPSLSRLMITMGFGRDQLEHNN